MEQQKRFINKRKIMNIGASNVKIRNKLNNEMYFDSLTFFFLFPVLILISFF